jgi:predicted metal-binding protein
VLQQVKGRLFESQTDREREKEREGMGGRLEVEKLLCRSEHYFDFTRNVIWMIECGRTDGRLLYNAWQC